MSRRALTAVAVLLASSPAGAHFVLESPPSWRAQDALGSPQKVGPCGEEGTGGATGVVTAYASGATVTITLDETIFHPGHYRVALAVHDRSELPPEPAVTPGSTACGSAAIEDPPVLPVLADGVLVHEVPFSGSRSIQVTLPADVTCARCTLQVLEFMSEHPVPCFYHHCADISIGAAVATSCTTDADCGDDDVCTTDRCDAATGRCAHDGVDASACDDGDACTLDACLPGRGCVSQRMTLADVGAGFLGTLPVQACAHVPAAVASLFRRADGLVARAARTPRKADRLLGRAQKALAVAARRAGKAKVAACSAALDVTLDRARARVGCVAR